MKKSLVLAMAMAMGVTASAYAANPFSDVPAGHWAYDSVNKLAAAGVIEGYGDSTFGGDKLMTRYEMAQIIAKAMAKGADVDRLAAEFAEELDNLGVRIAKLEKKSDNVKLTGQVRYRYTTSSNNGNEHNDLRSRLWINGQINDAWSYTGMVQNTQNFKNNKGEEKTKFDRAYVKGKLGGFNVTAGRYGASFANGNVYDTKADGAEISYGSKVKLKGFVGKASDMTTTNQTKDKEIETSYGKYYGGELSTDLGKFNLLGGYVKFKDMGEGGYSGDGDKLIEKGRENGIWYVGSDYKFDKNLAISAMYLKGNAKDEKGNKAHTDDKGWTAGVTYKGAEAADAGSWGLFANYYDQGGQTYVAHTTDANVFDNDGFKGWGVGTNYAFAKNIVGTVAYYDTVSKLNTNDHDNIVWADLTFTF